MAKMPPYPRPALTTQQTTNPLHVNSDGAETDPKSRAFIDNNIGGGGGSIQWSAILNKPTDLLYADSSPAVLGANLLRKNADGSFSVVEMDIAPVTQVQTDWDETNTALASYLANKPTDLMRIPANPIPTYYMQSDGEQGPLPDMINIITNTGGTNLYLSEATGDDSTGNGSAAAPWKTLEKVAEYVLNVITSDDINVYFEDGEYPAAYIKAHHGRLLFRGNTVNRELVKIVGILTIEGSDSLVGILDCSFKVTGSSAVNIRVNNSAFVQLYRCDFNKNEAFAADIGVQCNNGQFEANSCHFRCRSYGHSIHQNRSALRLCTWEPVRVGNYPFVYANSATVHITDCIKPDGYEWYALINSGEVLVDNVDVNKKLQRPEGATPDVQLALTIHADGTETWDAINTPSLDIDLTTNGIVHVSEVDGYLLDGSKTDDQGHPVYPDGSILFPYKSIQEAVVTESTVGYDEVNPLFQVYPGTYGNLVIPKDVNVAIQGMDTTHKAVSGSGGSGMYRVHIASISQAGAGSPHNVTSLYASNIRTNYVKHPTEDYYELIFLNSWIEWSGLPTTNVGYAGAGEIKAINTVFLGGTGSTIASIWYQDSTKLVDCSIYGIYHIEGHAEWQNTYVTGSSSDNVEFNVNSSVSATACNFFRVDVKSQAFAATNTTLSRVNFFGDSNLASVRPWPYTFRDCDMLGITTDAAHACEVSIYGGKFGDSPVFAHNAGSLRMFDVSMFVDTLQGYVAINKSGTASYMLSGVVRDASIDVLNGTRLPQGNQAADVWANYTPTNYTATAGDVKSHLAGINAALGSGGGTPAGVPFTAVVNVAQEGGYLLDGSIGGIVPDGTIAKPFQDLQEAITLADAGGHTSVLFSLHPGAYGSISIPWRLHASFKGIDTERLLDVLDTEYKVSIASIAMNTTSVMTDARLSVDNICVKAFQYPSSYDRRFEVFITNCMFTFASTVPSSAHAQAINYNMPITARDSVLLQGATCSSIYGDLYALDCMLLNLTSPMWTVGGNITAQNCFMINANQLICYSSLIPNYQRVILDNIMRVGETRPTAITRVMVSGGGCYLNKVDNCYLIIGNPLNSKYETDVRVDNSTFILIERTPSVCYYHVDISNSRWSGDANSGSGAGIKDAANNTGSNNAGRLALYNVSMYDHNTDQWGQIIKSGDAQFLCSGVTRKADIDQIVGSFMTGSTNRRGSFDIEILPTAWVNDEVTVQIPEMNGTEDGDIGIPSGASKAQALAIQQANIQVIQQTAGSMNLRANGVVPTNTIYITVRI